jgi:uncharacterized membrane protein YbhN (UPF0104 family)
LPNALRYALSGLLLAFIAWRLHAESYSIEQLLIDWGQLSVLNVLLAAALLPVNLGLESWKWFLAVRRLYPGLRPHQSGLAILQGSALGLVTPNRLGEYAGRVFSLPPGQRIGAAVATFVCRLSQLGATLLFGLLALVYLTWQAIGPEIIVLGLLSPLLLLVTSVSVFLLQPLLFRRIGALVLRFLLRRHWQTAARALEALLHIPAPLARHVLGLALLRWIVFAFQYLLLLQAFGLNASPVTLMALVAVVYLIKSFIPSIALAELGIREHIAMGVFKWVLVPGALAFQATLLLYLLNIVLPGLVGALLIHRLRLPWLSSAR